jgi:hypothetical protein
MSGFEPSEELRLKLLAEEQKLRSKQPPHWAKTKYRKYAERLNALQKKDVPVEKKEVSKRVVREVCKKTGGKAVLNKGVVGGGVKKGVCGKRKVFVKRKK